MADQQEHDQEAKIAELERAVAGLQAERDAAQAREAALAEILTEINASPGDAQPVFQTILDKAVHLCGIAFASLYGYDGKQANLVSHHGMPPDWVAYRRANPPTAKSAASLAQLLATKRPVHILDRKDTDDYRAGERAAVDLGGGRTLLLVPLLKGEAVLGLFLFYRREVRAFTEEQISLLENFAAHAVIAMENARLITEQRARQRELEEALESQTATAEILNVIARSPNDSQPVFETIARSVRRLTDALHSAVYTYDGDLVHLAAFDGAYGAAGVDALMRAFPQRPGGTGATTRAVATGDVQYIPDVQVDPDYAVSYVAQAANYRSVVSVPMLRDGRPVGAITAATATVAAFGERKIGLLKTFAEQAAIALSGAENYHALQERSAELARSVIEQREALERQTAMADVMAVINESPGDLDPVFDTLLDRAMRLCEAKFGIFNVFDGEGFQLAAGRGLPPAFVAFLRSPERSASRTSADTGRGRILQGEDCVQIADLMDDDLYRSGNIHRRALTDLAGARTAIWVALRKDGKLLGAINFYRQEVRPFSDAQVTLLRNFAAQAVIAMENARLITEQREALEQQTATAEVLGVINANPGNLTPVFEAILEKAHQVCGTEIGTLSLYQDGAVRPAASRGLAPAHLAMISRGFPPTPGHAALMRGEPWYHVTFPEASSTSDAYDEVQKSLINVGMRTGLLVPLRRNDATIGAISAFRLTVKPFTDKEIALLQNFAEQAVIAMENARLITEQREALEQQTATSEVLGVINAHPGDLDPVFDAMLKKAMHLCEAECGGMFTYDGATFSTVATCGVPPAMAAYRQRTPPEATPGSRHARMLQTRAPVHVLDVADTDGYRNNDPSDRVIVDLGGARTVLNVPLLKDGSVVGHISVYRTERRLFTDKQISLLENFAAQAVIAMENARLLGELRERTEALAKRNSEFGERIEQQAATIDVLKVMSSSPGDPQPVFDLIAHRAREFCGSDSGAVLDYDGNFLSMRAIDASLEDTETAHAAFPRAASRDSTSGRAILDRAPAHIADIGSDPDYRKERDPNTAAMLAVPMLREGTPIGVVSIGRSSPGYFTDVQIELLRTFAEQAVIAITSAEAYHALRQARDAAEASLADLRRVQVRLVQSEKMASLGQLTAGIAHEIKNPLNFVNNFSDLSVDLLDELREVLEPVEAGIDAKARDEIEELTATLKSNLAKIAEHGRRADSIVKNMLEHSRTGASERRAVDLNATAEEALNLAYHGARAEIPGFNITLEKDLSPEAGQVELYPQEFTRVLVNLINNGFYAARKRAERGEVGFEPTLRLSTHATDGQVEVRVRDNGTGIPAEMREKIFEPFFTTKPAGEGTGLGLSLSYDIVVKQHGGQIGVESEPGNFTEFRVSIPRHASAANEGTQP